MTGANVLVAIFAERESHAAYFLQEQDMTRYDAVNYISHGIAKRAGMSDARPVRGVDDDAATVEERGGEKKKADALEAYCVNLNEKAKKGRIDPLIGRDSEISRTIQILCRRQKNNRCWSATPASARPPSPRASPSASSTRTCPRSCRTPPSSRWTWAHCSPARAIAAISRSA